MKRAALFTLLFALASLAQESTLVFRSNSNLVIVDVIVRDKSGKEIDNLKHDDFTLLEDGKPQKIAVFEFQKLSTAPAQPAPAMPLVVATTPPIVERKATNSPLPGGIRYQDRRLIVLLFDLSSMQPAEQVRATESARKFLTQQMTASDLVSVMTFSNELKTLQEFTGDRDLLDQAIHKIAIGEGSDLNVVGDTGDSSNGEDTGAAFVADETEFNLFNTDMKLSALQTAARTLGALPEKKAVIYFSSGISKTGVENQSQLRSTVNAAVRANVSFYPVDARGLTAIIPGGDASHASQRGSGLFSGAAQSSQRNSFNDSQETLVSLASDTGGKAFLDNNNLSQGIAQAQKDIGSYYILGYYSANAALDGRYRRIQVKLAPRVTLAKVKLDFRKGYFAPTTFARMSEANKEAQLQRALESENPITDLPLAVELDYFRIDKSKYFVPVSVEIPGSALAFHSKGSKAATELDFTAEVRDARDKPAAAVRDTIPLKLDEATAGQVTRKHIQYDTGLTLTPGKYKLRFVARENGEGKVGTFETPFTIPDLSSGSALRFSSVIFSNQRGQQSAGVKNDKKLVQQNPLIDSTGQKIVPNVIRVFRPGQDLYVYLEVYDPTIPENLPQNFRPTSVAADLALFDGSRKVLETAPVRVNRPDAKRSNTIPLRLQASLKDLRPGKYVCQVNIIDELGRKFAFPRTAVVLLPAATQAAPAGGQ